MVNLFGLSKERDKKKEAKGKKRSEVDNNKSDDDLQEQQQHSEAAAGQHEQPQPQEEAAAAQNSTDNAEAAEDPIGAVTSGGPAAPASGQAAGSESSQGSTHEKNEGIARNASSYVGGIDGRCHTCGFVKMACNCQHCHHCHRFLMTLSSRRHCRRCWRAMCPKCSAYERTNDFLRGELSRTCKECAIPHSLVYLTELAYSIYETMGMREKHKAQDSKDEGEAEGGNDNGACHDTRVLDARPFRWGLYALGCGMEAPRRCINPSCSNPISYDYTCARCKLATVTLAFHKLRHAELVDLADTASLSGSKPAGMVAEAVEDAVRLEYAAIAAARTTAEDDDLFDAALPNDTESHLFASLQDSGWSSRKVLLSLVACAIAAESSAMPHISLAMMDMPTYAKLLRPVKITETFSVFSAPGHVRFIAFNSGASNRSSIHQILGAHLTQREAWTSPALRHSKSVAKIVADAGEAHGKGLTECVAKLNVRDGMLAYLAENDVLRGLPEMVDNMAGEGFDIVLCGHGVGGACASWVAATFLLENTVRLEDRLMCVTFGAPLVANYSLTDLLIKHDLHRNFHHFVNASDMVPRMSYVDALLDSGNTCGTASIVGYGEGMASAAEVRDAVVMWVGKHEEPHRSGLSHIAASKEGFSISSLARRIRNTNAVYIKEKKVKSAGSQKLASVTEDFAGDIFRTSREPFDNNVIRMVDETTAPTLHDVDFQRFATAEHRGKQALDPYGCYHFLWHTRGKYMCTDDPRTSIGLLSDRTDLRVRLQDHLLSSYNRAMTEYIYSATVDQ